MNDTNNQTHSLLDQTMKDKLIVCPECDLMLKPPKLEHGQIMTCPRCNHDLHKSIKNSLERTLALALSGLTLILPAFYLPIFRLEVLGIKHEANMFTGVISLFKNEMWILAMVVLLASILVPLVKLLLIIYVATGLKLKRCFAKAPLCLRWFQHIDEWGMLEVYTLGIIVAYTKLISMASVIPGIGLYCFISVLIIVSCLSLVIDKNYFWQQLEAHHHAK